MLNDFLNSDWINKTKKDIWNVSLLCYTLAGNKCYLLTITEDIANLKK